MEITATDIPDLLLLTPKLHGDDRGYFMETFRQSHFEEQGLDVSFVQDNQSKSVQGTLRGLHYQLENPQGKLLRVLSGEVFDVAVDLRRSSSFFGRWVGVTLSAANRKQFWIPAGFAHGFYVTSKTAEITYKCTEYYHPEDEHCLLWNDPELAIDWPLVNPAPLLSAKDARAKTLGDAALFD